MAISIAKLAIMLTTDTSGMMRGFAQAESAIGGFSAASMGVTTALTALAAAEAAFVQEGVRMKMAIEQIRIQLDTLGGSAEIGGALMSQFVELARNTPFNMEDVAMSGKVLLAMGSSAGDVAGQIKMLGNVAAGTGQPVRELAQVFGEVQNAGRLTSNELRQFNMRGIPLLSELSDMMGVSKTAIRDMVEEGKIGADVVEEAFERMAGAGGRFDGMMEKLANSLQGRWEKLKEAMSMSAFEVVGGNKPFGPAGAAMGGMEQFFDNVAAGAKAMHAALSGDMKAFNPATFIMDEGARKVRDLMLLAEQGKVAAAEAEGKKHQEILDEMVRSEEKAIEKMRKEADKITRSLMTPDEVMADHIMDAKNFLQNGLIDLETYRRQVENIKDEYLKATREAGNMTKAFRSGLNPGADFNTSAGSSAISSARAEMNRMVHEQKESNTHLKKIEAALAGVATF